MIVIKHENWFVKSTAETIRERAEKARKEGNIALQRELEIKALQAEWREEDCRQRACSQDSYYFQ